MKFFFLLLTLILVACSRDSGYEPWGFYSETLDLECHPYFYSYQLPPPQYDITVPAGETLSKREAKKKLVDWSIDIHSRRAARIGDMFKIVDAIDCSREGD